MSTSLRAGAARAVLTPPAGVDLCGYAARPGPSVGVHDDLRAGALYLATDDSALLLMTADLIGLSHEQAQRIRDEAAGETGVSPDAIMVTCSHTHSGPATPALHYLGEVDDAWMWTAEEKLVGAAVAAARAARPAALGWRRDDVRIHINRRHARPRGAGPGAPPEPADTLLPWADVLAVDTAGGRPLARWFTHACHAVVMDGDNLLLSADWPGYAQWTVEAAEPEAAALFAQGCCGDLNPSPRGTFDIAERHGKTIAGAVIKAAAQAERAGHVTLGHVLRHLDLPLQDPPPVAEAERLAAQLQADYDAREADMVYAEKQWYGGWAKWGRELVDLARRGVTGQTTPFPVQVLRVGDGAIVGLPGEVFAQYAINIADLSPARRTAVVAYTNGYCSYVPTEAAYAEGGYEVDTAFRATLPTMLAPECERLILSAAREGLAALF